ncbi:methyltransferase domain-containing protein [Streptomyces halstedii]|uniref:class I SAM-dependent methyltransferase n=1 Tax=Streptomyces halstedii TaxID=1944 RepID=UPI003460CE7D
MADDLDLRHQLASSFGAAATAYAEYRPGYPATALEWALAPVAKQKQLHVLDLGAGTGKLTEALVKAGIQVTAVEPDQAMLSELRRRLPDVAAHVGVAEEIPLPDGTVDAVLAGQALHWFEPERALPEIARVLRPGGVLAGLWIAYDGRVEWVAELDRLFPGRLCFAAQQAMRGHEAYGTLESAEFPYTQQRTAESLTATLATHSPVLVLPAEEQKRVLGHIRAYLDSLPGVDENFTVPLITAVERVVIR